MANQVPYSPHLNFPVLIHQTQTEQCNLVVVRRESPRHGNSRNHHEIDWQTAVLFGFILCVD